MIRHGTNRTSNMFSVCLYRNAVLYGTSAVVIRRLQMVLDTAARLVVGLGKIAHHTGSSRRPSLAVSASEDTVQYCHDDFTLQLDDDRTRESQMLKGRR